MNYSSRLLPVMLAVVAACAPAATRGTGASESAPGILRVTNYAREAVQVFLTTASGDTFLRLIQPGASESFHLPGTSPGEVVHLKAKTTSGREYTPREGITLGDATCARNFGAPSATLACEWILP
jgi:hypothetical protein